ncbi:choice-of-anchor A family protein [Yinghuangia seranimata]|uniref:choice-of-anchor A family protein n=1 Tax=Yinghuangia seranimata TaxID=408067 RepID=UPI00248B6B16|nr:choice-of-anchor A family protein [Yinghuangia seranimata]MDI2127361.1 choice-of-anchor A family protein [Yinghuangia seranimata]
MRMPAAAAALAVTGGLAFAVTPSASAATAPVCAANPLGTAGLYAEFVAGDATRYSDSEGAVAVGGDAYFGDGATNQGFSIGSRLTPADLKKLPGGDAMVVAGTLYANQVVLAGPGVYGKLVDRHTANFAVDGAAKQGASPVDFAAEFAKLRTLSRGLAETTRNGSVGHPMVEPGKPGQSLLFEGKDARLNVFAVNAADLQNAPEIDIKVPAGASTVINVLGGAYNMDANARTGVATYHVNLWDPAANAWVTDDYGAGSAAFKDVRSKLLWNLPEATSVLKNGTSWPGTILAPYAKVEFGRALGGSQIAPGHLNGSVIAKELVTIPGAETHHMGFTGCLPGKDTPGTPATPNTPTTPTPPATPGKPLPPAPPVPPCETVIPPKPRETPGTPTTSAPPASPPAEVTGPPLAQTGGSSSTPIVLGAGAALLLGVAATAVGVSRRRRSADPS